MAKFPILHKNTGGVIISSSVFRLLLSQRLLSGRNIVDNEKAATKYFLDRKIGEKSEVHLIAHLGQKKSAGVIRTAKLQEVLEKALPKMKKDAVRDFKIVVAFGSPVISDKLLDHDALIGDANE